MTTATAARLGAPNISARPGPHTLPTGVAACAIVAGTLFLATHVTWRQGALFLVGVAAGLVLYHAAFGFTSAWRSAIVEAKGAGLRAQMLMLAVTCALFFPALARGELFGEPVRGSVSPVGLSVIAGAFLFGIGMQLGGGCASGTLYTAGGGSVRMLITLAAFIAGSVLGVWHFPLWEHAPAMQPVSVVAHLGPYPALLASWALFGAIAAVSLRIERSRYGYVDGLIATRASSASFFRGPWPLLAGAIGLAAVNAATLALAGRPWGVTSAFALWGSKVLMLAGVHVESWPYWQAASRARELHASVFNDVTTVMDVGIVLGALLAAALAGRFAPTWRIPLRSLAAAVLGGVMLGYGARIAYGCNIGAYFSGIASGSLHGWLWFPAAFAGSVVGTRLRPIFGLRV